MHIVQLEPMIKAHSSGRMVSSSISDVVITSVHSEKTRLKKLMMMMMKMTIKPQHACTRGLQWSLCLSVSLLGGGGGGGICRFQG